MVIITVRSLCPRWKLQPRQQHQGNYGNKNDRSGPYVPPQNREIASRDGEGSMARVEDIMQKMMRSFDASDEYAKELRNDLTGIGKKVDTHTISIKHLELQMAQLSATMNTRQPGTLLSNTVQNPKNDGHCMTITTRGGKQTIDTLMPFGVEKVIRDDDTMVEVSGELEDKAVKDVELPQKVTSTPKPPPPFPQRLVKKTEDDKY